MHASVRRYELGAGSRGAGAVRVLMGRLEEGLVPLLSQVPGFVAHYALDTENGIIALVSVFEHEEGSEEADRVVKEWGQENFRNILQQAPQVTSGEVIVHSP
jgi:hypothetical protein